METGVTGVCGGNGTIVQFHALNLCLNFLVPCCHGIHLFAHADLLFIEEPLALSFCDDIGPHCTCIAIGCFCLNVSWDT